MGLALSRFLEPEAVGGGPVRLLLPVHLQLLLLLVLAHLVLTRELADPPWDVLRGHLALQKVAFLLLRLRREDPIHLIFDFVVQLHILAGEALFLHGGLGLGFFDAGALDLLLAELRLFAQALVVADLFMAVAADLADDWVLVSVRSPIVL
jgi:hypothetical protein